MKRVFLEKSSPAPNIFSHKLGKLYYFGSANIQWSSVANRLAMGIFPNEIRGEFAFVWLTERETIAAVDHLSSTPLFYSDAKVSNIFFDLLQETPKARKNEKIEWQMYFLGGQSIGEETNYHEIRRVQPGHVLKNGQQVPYLNYVDYLGDATVDEKKFSGIVEGAVLKRAREKNALLVSGGTDSVTLAGICKKLNLENKFTFLHVYSALQAQTEKKIVEEVSIKMDLDVEYIEIPFSGNILPEQSGRQYSFWTENPFLGKRRAVEVAGHAGSTIFTGELGDQLFGGPKNATLLNYSLQKKVSPEEIASIWINLSHSFGRNCAIGPSLAIEWSALDSGAFVREVYFDLIEKIATLFSQMKTKDILNRFLLLNYMIKGPYRTWAYSQDTLNWAHPFTDWEIFEYCFGLRSKEKINGGGISKWILLNTWKANVSDLPWRRPKHGFGIPDISKFRSVHRDPQHK